MYTLSRVVTPDVVVSLMWPPVPRSDEQRRP
jgi:hypothetical protein